MFRQVLSRQIPSVRKFSNMSASKWVKVGLCQIEVGRNKEADIKVADGAIRDAVSNGCNLVVLPECFNCPYSSNAFPDFKEMIPNVGEVLDSVLHPTSYFASSIAKELGIYLVAGSIPEDCDGKIYNTSAVYDPSGALIAKHRKMHLFDIDIPGKITFCESDTLTAGNEITLFDVELSKIGCYNASTLDNKQTLRIGLGICYDIRFPEYAMVCREEGADMLIYPGAFNMTTGPAHWELLQRGRAVDTQCYVAMCSPARRLESSYHAWGHSTIVSAFGKVLDACEEKPALVTAEVDQHSIYEFRQNVPTYKQKRFDQYTHIQKK